MRATRCDGSPASVCTLHPQFCQTKGFPIVENEAILALSDPPTYTACPNPFLPEIVAQWQEEWVEIRAGLGLPDDAANGYSREPFAADVSEGKNDPTFGNAPFLPHQGAAQGDHALHPALRRRRRPDLRNAAPRSPLPAPSPA